MEFDKVALNAIGNTQLPLEHRMNISFIAEQTGTPTKFSLTDLFDAPLGSVFWETVCHFSVSIKSGLGYYGTVRFGFTFEKFL